ncbi:MAG: hypothetical protein AAB524_02230 [Patescibacteria group bacterium]
MNVAQLLEKSKTISLVLPFGAQQSDTQTAFLLACGLKKLGKQVSIEHIQTPLLASSLKEKTFVVSLKGLAPWIARVRYEKDAQDLKLYFTLNQGEVSPEALSFQMQDQADLTIIVGDKALQNNNSQPLSATVLSASETKEPLLNLLCSQENPQTKLLGAILSNLEYISHLDTHLTILRQENLRNIRVESKNLPLLVPELRESFGDQCSYLFLLGSLLGAQGVLWSPSPQLRAKVRDIAGGQQKGPWVLLHPTPLSSEQLKYAFLS